MKILRVRLPDSVFEIPLITTLGMTPEQLAALSLRDFSIIISSIENAQKSFHGATATLEIINGGPNI